MLSSLRLHLGDGAEAVGDVRELQARARGQVARQLAGDLRGDVAHGRKHADAAVLDLGLAAALEVLHAAVSGETKRIEESDWILHTTLVLEGPQWRGSV